MHLSVYMFVPAVSLLGVLFAGLCSSSCSYVSVSVFPFHFVLSTSLSPPCLFKNWGPEVKFSLHKVTEGRGREGGKRRDMQLQGKVPQKVFNIYYKTTLIFNEHTRSYFSGEIQSRGVE